MTDAIHRTRFLGFTAVGVLAAALLGSCAPSTTAGLVTLTSRTATPVQLTTSFSHGAYTVEPAKTSLILSTVSLDRLADRDFDQAEVVHVEFLWQPRAGRTPVSADATNLSIRYVVLVDDQIGLYGGGGFGWPRGDAGDAGFGVTISGSNLALLDSTDGFRDLLTPARLAGRLDAKLDATTAIRLRDVISQIVTDGLGRTRWVDATPSQNPPSDPHSDLPSDLARMLAAALDAD
ncbi:MAG: hypothetical protein CMJ54_08870 [Planctomycetaceae bacterium]|nr:hypothetical protein [Planctomycetaceae bacterium]